MTSRHAGHIGAKRWNGGKRRGNLARRYPRNKFGVRTDKKGIEDRTADGVVFHSKKECLRYLDLKLLQRSGEITGLELQPKFSLDIAGIHICNYLGDFRYKKGPFIVIEDVKGRKTDTYVIKKKLMRALYAIDILET